MLLANGSNVDYTDGQERTALMIAAQQGRTNELELLIINKANYHLENQNGWAALHLAAWHDQAVVVQMLIANGSKVDDTDGQGRTSLMIAAQQGRTNVLGY